MRKTSRRSAKASPKRSAKASARRSAKALAERPATTIRVAADTQGLARVSDVYDAFTRANRVPDTIRRDVYVAVEELVSNVFRHGSRRRKAHISLTLAIERGKFRVEIVDDGPPFDPFSAPAPDTTQALQDRPIGGLGILFVNNLTDDHSYIRRAGRNRVTLRRALRN